MNQNFDYQPSNENPSSFFDPVPPVEEKKPKRGFSIASLVLGIVSICTCCCCCLCDLLIIPLFCASLAIAFAFVARAKSADKKFGGMAIAGLILGIIGFVICAVLLGVILMIPENAMQDFWVEYESVIREEMGDEFYEEFYNSAFGNTAPAPAG